MNKKIKGFTLIELMVVVAIVAILTAIALPSYQSFVLQSHRTTAINGVMDIASAESKYYTANNAYIASLTTLGYANDPFPVPDTTNTYYNLSVAVGVGSTSFTVTATTAGNQTNDTACGNYTYTDLGVKNITGTGTSSDCWKQ